MTRNKILSLLFMPVLFFACQSSRVITVLKTDQPLKKPYAKLVVFAITENDSMRASLENAIVSTFESGGYTCISSLRMFGSKGFANLDMEGTYLKFCDEGVDAVLTIVAIDKAYSKQHRKGMEQNYINSFYLHRIWDYRLLPKSIKNPVYETILFDLPTLSPHFVGRSRLRNNFQDINSVAFAARLIATMRKQNIVSLPSFNKKGF